MLAAVGRARDEELLVLLRDGDVARDALGELALGAVHAHELGLDRDGDAGGTGMGFRPMRDIGSYQTSATTSPPTPAWRASWPVITPEDVETIAVPMPPWTLGIVAGVA